MYRHFTLTFFVFLFVYCCCVHGQFHQVQHLPQDNQLKNGLSILQENGDQLSKSGYDVPGHYLDIINEQLEKLDVPANWNWTRCELDTYKLLRDLTKGTLYALKFLDSFAKPPSGIFDGHINWLGNYDECKQKVVINGSDYFEGNYCKVTLSIPQMAKALRGQMFSIGICVPSSCSENQTERFIDMGMALLQPMVANISAGSVSCDKEVEWKSSTYIAISVTAILIGLTLIGTLCDIIRSMHNSKTEVAVRTRGNEDVDALDNGYLGDDVGLINDERHSMDAQSPRWVGKILDVFICFSLVTNGGKLLNSRIQADHLGAINGIRVISMSWVILGHTFVFAMTLYSNTVTGISIIQRFSFQAIAQATVSVDSFFFLSGLLVCYLTLNELKKNDGRVNWFLFYFHRYWRLTPAYMFVILCYVGIFPLMIKGPNNIGLKDADVMGQKACEKYWWSNMLYINNFVPSSIADECLGWGWYLANDMQFYVISPILIYLLYRFVYVGLAIILGLIVFCLGLTGGLATKYGVSASLVGMMTEDMAENDAAINFMKLYIRPYHRIAPYLVGMITGYILHRYKNSFKLHWLLNVLGWCTATAICLSVIYGLYGYNHTLSPIPQGLASFYVAANRFAWSLGLAWLTFACLTGNGGPVNAILSYGLWAPLGRLTYCAYLIHPIIMYVVYLNLRTPIYYTDFTVAYYFMGHLLLAYACAFVLSLLIESPLMALEKLFLPKKDSTKNK